MGVRSLVSRASLQVVHVLPVETPGGWRIRIGVEQAVRRHGWRLALGPADADVLVVCGPTAPVWDELIERLWDQLPGPRARVALATAGEVDDGLTRAVRDLGDRRWQSREVRERSRTADPDEPVDMAGEKRDSEKSDHGDMDMDPSGIPLATGADDRDGLEMDELHVPLGPVLRYWPAGLVVWCVLHGDLVTAAVVQRLPGGADLMTTPADRAAAWCDGAVSTLRLAGADRLADRAVRFRDDLLDLSRADLPGAAAGLTRLARDVRTSRLLRWSLRGLGEIGAGPAAGDVFGRLCGQLDHAVTALQDDPIPALDVEEVCAALPVLLSGVDLAAARLIVASVWPAVEREAVDA